MCRIRIYLLALCVLVITTSATAAAPVFKAKVKLPFVLQSGSDVLEAGEYLVRIKLEGNHWILTLAPSKQSNKEVLNIIGDYADVPKQEQNFQKKYRLQIMRVSDPEKAGNKWIIFNLDIKNPGGDFQRLVFRTREAAR